MPRLFVAIRPQKVIREQLLARMHGVSGARWQDDAQLHLTLRFIGEVANARCDDIILALSRIASPAFDLQLHGIGAFDRKGRVETLWAGVTPLDAVKALHAKIDRAIDLAGFGSETRAFKPHITLARFGRTGADISAFVSVNAMLSSERFRVDAFHLYESTLSASGAAYTIVESFPLLPS
jgi:RNA 2',3'-cyclic 3'-phosphodiesterase